MAKIIINYEHLYNILCKTHKDVKTIKDVDCIQMKSACDM